MLKDPNVELGPLSLKSGKSPEVASLLVRVLGETIERKMQPSG